MSERYSFTGERDIDAVLSGLHELDLRSKTDFESRMAQIHELVLAVSNNYRDSEEVLRVLRDIQPLNCDSLSACERVAMCREYLSLHPSATEFRRSLFFDSSEAPPLSAENNIAFIENNYTDEAYSIFSAILGVSESLHLRSFDELCENIYQGKTEFGILPIENTENGKLPHFYSLIDKYELKITAVCSVDTSDSDSTSFALVRKNIEYPYVRFGHPDMLELFVPQIGNERFSEILTAAELCSMKLYRVDTLPLSYRSESFTTCPVFYANNADIDTFLLYMSLDFPQYTPVGIFTYIK